MRRGLLVTDQNVVNLRILGERVEIGRAAPRIGPDDVDPFAKQTLPDDFCAGVSHDGSYPPPASRDMRVKRAATEPTSQAGPVDENEGDHNSRGPESVKAFQSKRFTHKTHKGHKGPSVAELMRLPSGGIVRYVQPRSDRSSKTIRLRKKINRNDWVRSRRRASALETWSCAAAPTSERQPQGTQAPRLGRRRGRAGTPRQRKAQSRGSALGIEGLGSAESSEATEGGSEASACRGATRFRASRQNRSPGPSGWASRPDQGGSGRMRTTPPSAGQARTLRVPRSPGGLYARGNERRCRRADDINGGWRGIDACCVLRRRPLASTGFPWPPSSGWTTVQGG